VIKEAAVLDGLREPDGVFSRNEAVDAQQREALLIILFLMCIRLPMVHCLPSFSHWLILSKEEKRNEYGS
jgi:hypothetical protein